MKTNLKATLLVSSALLLWTGGVYPIHATQRTDLAALTPHNLPAEAKTGEGPFFNFLDKLEKEGTINEATLSGAKNLYKSNPAKHLMKLNVVLNYLKSAQVTGTQNTEKYEKELSKVKQEKEEIEKKHEIVKREKEKVEEEYKLTKKEKEELILRYQGFVAPLNIAFDSLAESLHLYPFLIDTILGNSLVDKLKKATSQIEFATKQKADYDADIQIIEPLRENIQYNDEMMNVPPGLLADFEKDTTILKNQLTVLNGDLEGFMNWVNANLTKADVKQISDEFIKSRSGSVYAKLWKKADAVIKVMNEFLIKPQQTRSYPDYLKLFNVIKSFSKDFMPDVTKDDAEETKDTNRSLYAQITKTYGDPKKNFLQPSWISTFIKDDANEEKKKLIKALDEPIQYLKKITPDIEKINDIMKRDNLKEIFDHHKTPQDILNHLTARRDYFVETASFPKPYVKLLETCSKEKSELNEKPWVRNLKNQLSEKLKTSKKALYSQTKALIDLLSEFKVGDTTLFEIKGKQTDKYDLIPVFTGAPTYPTEPISIRKDRDNIKSIGDSTIVGTTFVTEQVTPALNKLLKNVQFDKGRLEVSPEYQYFVRFLFHDTRDATRNLSPLIEVLIEREKKRIIPDNTLNLLKAVHTAQHAHLNLLNALKQLADTITHIDLEQKIRATKFDVDDYRKEKLDGLIELSKEYNATLLYHELANDRRAKYYVLTLGALNSDMIFGQLGLTQVEADALSNSLKNAREAYFAARSSFLSLGNLIPKLENTATQPKNMPGFDGNIYPLGVFLPDGSAPVRVGPPGGGAPPPPPPGGGAPPPPPPGGVHNIAARGIDPNLFVTKYLIKLGKEYKLIGLNRIAESKAFDIYVTSAQEFFRDVYINWQLLDWKPDFDKFVEKMMEKYSAELNTMGNHPTYHNIDEFKNEVIAVKINYSNIIEEFLLAYDTFNPKKPAWNKALQDKLLNIMDDTSDTPENTDDRIPELLKAIRQYMDKATTAAVLLTGDVATITRLCKEMKLD